MPVKFAKAFGRRKSTAIPYEDVPDEPVEHSFKVFERPDGGSKSFDAGLKLGKPVAAAPPHTRSRTAAHLEDDNMFVNVGKNRGSGASNTNTASTTDNSSRLSAASTTPSSTDVAQRDDWRSPKERSLEISVPPIPKSSSAFSLKNAGRTLSWGRHKHPSLPSPKEQQSPTIDEEQSGRPRAITTSSYASTATPPRVDENNDLGLSLGGDFSDMFAGFGKRKSVVMETETNRSTSNSPETLPTGPANRSYQSSRLITPSPLSFDKNKEVEPSPYSWSSQQSREGLMSSISPPPVEGRDTPPPVPQHNSTRPKNEYQSHNKPPRNNVADGGLRRSSALSPRRQSTLEYGDAVDEDARLLRESISASRNMEAPNHNSRVRDSWALPSDKLEDVPVSTWKYASAETTPKAKKVEPVANIDDMFDAQSGVSASATPRFLDKPWSPNMNSNGRTPKAPTNKVMTPAQFERYRQDQERLRSAGGKDIEDQEEEEEIYDDDEDDAEKAKALAKQRRKQEAHMAVYRQQMMKVTGEATSNDRPGVLATQSSPNLTLGGSGSGTTEDPEEDEEIPLAILQAHGFPSKTKPPQVRSMGSNPNLRAGSISGGVVPSGSLPVFARNLPQDPYYGAGIVKPAHRESMAFSGGAESNSGVPSRGLPPGGLVGVIASEERSRAMRRGSPNPEGTYGPAPSNGFNGMAMQLPPNSMYNGMGPPPQQMGPTGPMGPMKPMMLTPGDAAQIQMSQQMSQFMQMQMQFMHMMTGAQGQPQQQQQQNGHMSHASVIELPRPGSAQALRPGSSSHQRAMTMLEPNAAPWMQQGRMYTPSIRAQGNSYAPSIAPSERSNIGLPGRYRPVSHVAPKDVRNSTMSGALPSWENKSGSATIKTVKKSGNVSDDDDQEGWEEMAKKREKKKSNWRIKKDREPSSSGLKEMLSYVQS